MHHHEIKRLIDEINKAVSDYIDPLLWSSVDSTKGRVIVECRKNEAKHTNGVIELKIAVNFEDGFVLGNKGEFSKSTFNKNLNDWIDSNID